MNWSDVATFVFIASLLVMSPGPNGLLIAKTVPTSGKAAGFANVAGFVTAFFVHGSLSILGISIILLQSAVAFTIVKYLGAAYLIWIGIKALTASLRGERVASKIAPARKSRTLARAYLEGFMTCALNPKVSMFYLAAFPQFMTVGENAITSSFFLVFLHSAINATWFGAMVLLFARLSAMARGGSFQRWLKGVTGVVFIGFGLKLAAIRSSV